MMRRYIAIILCAAMLISVAAAYAHADLRTLMRVGSNQARIAKALKKETTNYNRVKQAIEKGKLKEGMSAKKIKRRYGEPIIDMFDEKRSAYKWLYMPATSTHFEGEKLYLFVDKDEKLVGWKLVGKQEN